MKVMTIFGTRPEIIRLSLIIKKLDTHCEHITVHTGQNYDAGLSEVFLHELGVRTPDEHLGIKEADFGAQAGQIISSVDRILDKHKPDKVLILGDTNSALSSIVAARRGIPVFHMEAGNRCFDDRVPEEVNRRIVDHSSTILLPYTTRSKENLADEGISRDRIYVTGNPIKEVLDVFSADIDGSLIKKNLEVEDGGYFLATLHRSENVDIEERLAEIFSGFEKIVGKYKKPLLISVHPRTAARIREFGFKVEDKMIKLLEPLGFFDFVCLEKNAFAVLTDSGTVQEECSIFHVPNVTVRDVTERPETVESGSNIISGADSDSMVRAVDIATSQKPAWVTPSEYMTPSVSDTIVKIVLGYTSLRRHQS